MDQICCQVKENNTCWILMKIPPGTWLWQDSEMVRDDIKMYLKTMGYIVLDQIGAAQDGVCMFRVLNI
jgi:hypothetical protein